MVPSAPSQIGLGVDVVDVRDIAASIAQHGTAYTDRVFTQEEVRYCRAAMNANAVAQRFAARFAAKEAVVKALQWSDQAVAWRSIEVVRADDGSCTIELHEPVRTRALAWGVTAFAVSMSHTEVHAIAVVTATRARASQHE